MRQYLECTVCENIYENPEQFETGPTVECFCDCKERETEHRVINVEDVKQPLDYVSRVFRDEMEYTGKDVKTFILIWEKYIKTVIKCAFEAGQFAKNMTSEEYYTMTYIKGKAYENNSNRT